MWLKINDRWDEYKWLSDNGTEPLKNGIALDGERGGNYFTKIAAGGMKFF